MWPTTEVGVYVRDWTQTDRLGNHVIAYADVAEVDVLIAPGATTDLDSSRPEGVRAALTLHFPKSWTGDLRGAKVVIGGTGRWDGTYRVIGDPMPYVPSITPTKFCMPVEVERFDG